MFRTIEAKHWHRYTLRLLKLLLYVFVSYFRWSLVVILEQIFLTRLIITMHIFAMVGSAIQMRKIVRKFLPHVQCVSLHVAIVARRQANDNSHNILSRPTVAPTAMNLASACKSGTVGESERHVRLFFQFMQRGGLPSSRGMFKQTVHSCHSSRAKLGPLCWNREERYACEMHKASISGYRF